MPLVAGLARPAAADPRLTPELVTRAVGPVLSAARRARIERVLARRLVSVTLVLENLYDPHNGAAALRTCEALGLLHVHVIEGGSPFFFSRKVSQSAHKWLAVHRYASTRQCLEALRGAGFALWAAVAPPRRAATPLPAAPPAERPLALLFGNEHTGLSAEARALADGCFSIPLAGFSESLNLSVSAALALHQAVARRRALRGDGAELDPAAAARLRAAYYARSSPHAVSLVLAALRPSDRR